MAQGTDLREILSSPIETAIRSPAKVQSALLEAMQERQVTIGDETYKLPRAVPRAR